MENLKPKQLKNILKKRKVNNMGTHSKKKTTKVENGIKVTGYAPLRQQTVAGSMKRSKAIAKKNKAEILKKEAAGGYKNTPLSKKPVSIAFREIFKKKPKLKQKKRGK